GAGGSFGFADPTSEIGFAYVMNKAGFHIFADPRELSLREAVYEAIASLEALT
ncbi:MAG: EstA family serine hydrolase, partial [Chloroflexi bacterium]|nr:EstA family serine hydrolase [Chloroflexota bacterium]